MRGAKTIRAVVRANRVILVCLRCGERIHTASGMHTPLAPEASVYCACPQSVVGASR